MIQIFAGNLYGPPNWGIQQHQRDVRPHYCGRQKDPIRRRFPVYRALGGIGILGGGAQIPLQRL